MANPLDKKGGGTIPGAFLVLDLPSQAPAVQRLLRGRTPHEKLAWLGERGRLFSVPASVPGARQTYVFESVVGLECVFFIDGDRFVFFGDHTTYTVDR